MYCKFNHLQALSWVASPYFLPFFLSRRRELKEFWISLSRFLFSFNGSDHDTLNIYKFETKVTTHFYIWKKYSHLKHSLAWVKSHKLAREIFSYRLRSNLRVAIFAVEGQGHRGLIRITLSPFLSLFASLASSFLSMFYNLSGPTFFPFFSHLYIFSFFLSVILIIVYFLY